MIGSKTVGISLVVVLFGSLYACTGVINSSSGAEATHGPNTSTGGANSASGGSAGTSASGGGQPTVPIGPGALECTQPGIVPGTAPLRRLTNQQYRNTLSALFDGLVAVPSVALPDEVLVSGFSNAAVGQTSTLALVEGYQGAALAIANAVVAGSGLDQLAPCASNQTAHACGDAFVSSFGAKAFRRPLETAEHDRLLALFDAQQAAYGYSAAIRDTLEATLLAPQFAFRVEYGKPSGATNSAVALTSYEVASRLAYFFTDAPPDATLAAAAQNDGLDATTAIQAQAQRLLSDPKAVAVVSKFHDEWLRLSKLDNMSKSATAFPTFDISVSASMATATRQFISDTFWKSGMISTLLTDTHAYVDANLAPLYGVPAPAAMSWVDVSNQPRAGILTQVGLMSALAKSATDDPIHRGLFVLSYLLCSPPNPPPAGVPALQDSPAGDPHTTRQHIELTHSPPACAGCHDQIDGIGFGFENYDAIGQYRTQENGYPVDATGSFSRTQDIDGPFDGVVDMAKKLAQSKQVQQCVATQWFNFAMGKAATDADSCALKPIAEAIQASGGDMKQLLITIATSDGFRYFERQAGATP